MEEIKVMENPIPTGYYNLEECVKSWGDKGIRIYDGMIRQSMKYGGISDKDIHTPPITRISVDVVIPFECKEKI